MDNEQKRDGDVRGRARGMRNGLIRRRAAGTMLLAGAVAIALAGGYLFGGGCASPDTAHVENQDTVRALAPRVWTCSMHPQVRSDKPGKCPICFMDLVPVTPGDTGGDGSGRELRMTPEAVKLAGIRTAKVERKDVEVRIDLAGDVNYDETRIAEIASWVPGRIDALYVKSEGEKVRKGDRLALVYSPKLISAQEELVQAARSLAKAQEALDSGDQRAGSRISAAAAARRAVESAGKKLDLLGLTAGQIEHVKSTGEISERMVTYSPMSGVVTAMHAREGAYVDAGSKICSIADLSRVWIDLYAYQSDIALIEKGQKVKFETGAYPGRVFEGKVSFIDYVLDPVTRTARVRAEASNADGSLKPGMFVAGTVRARPSGLKPGAPPLVIPSTAPLLTGRRAVVYVKKKGDEEAVFEGREIELGPRAGEYYIVRSGLDEGEEVVTSGAFRIDSELEIQAKPSMMSPAASDEPGKPGAGVRNALEVIYREYFAVQMALAADDHSEAAKKYGALAAALGAFDQSLITDKGLDDWKRLRSDLVKEARKGAGSADIEAARKVFYDVSRMMIELHGLFGHPDDLAMYLAFCPMARDNAGAYWIQESDTIFNSFYGASMLRCGTIKKKLDPED